MALIDKSLVNEVVEKVSDKIDEGTKKATNLKKYELASQIADDIRNVPGGFNDSEYTEFKKSLLRAIGFKDLE